MSKMETETWKVLCDDGQTIYLSVDSIRLMEFTEDLITITTDYCKYKMIGNIHDFNKKALRICKNSVIIVNGHKMDCGMYTSLKSYVYGNQNILKELRDQFGIYFEDQLEIMDATFFSFLTDNQNLSEKEFINHYIENDLALDQADYVIDDWESQDSNLVAKMTAFKNWFKKKSLEH